MNTRREQLEKSLLQKNFARVKDPDFPATIHDQIAMREKFHIHALIQDVPAEDKWRIKLTSALEKVLPSSTPSEAVALYELATNLFEDNRAEFLASDPDDCSLSLRKITIPSLPADAQARQRSLN